MYTRHGFGLYRVDLKDTGFPIGLCGLLRHESLPDVDIGFAFLPQHRGRDYAQEAAAATMDYGLRVLQLPLIVATVSSHNAASIRLLEKLGLQRRSTVRLTPQGDEARPFR
jgi:ribosomal-protein-alanine N-acetyltransferase